MTPVEPPLLDAVTRLVALLDSPQDIGPLAPLVLREITYRVLAGPQGLAAAQIASAGAPAQRIARAIRWLKDHFADPLRIESLAKHVRMSPSAFHLHFKSVTAMSPLQYQKRLRLQEARRLMLGEGLDAAEAAFRVGYESPSQFSREYRRMFGAPPRRTWPRSSWRSRRRSVARRLVQANVPPSLGKGGWVLPSAIPVTPVNDRKSHVRAAPAVADFDFRPGLLRLPTLILLLPLSGCGDSRSRNQGRLHAERRTRATSST